MGKRTKLRSSIALVCEGQNTEPLYFKQYWDLYAKDAGAWDNLHVFPEPPLESPLPSHTSLRKKRRVKGANLSLDNPYLTWLRENEIPNFEAIYEDTKAMPLRYVAQAEMILVEGIANRAWAVYDKNGHSHHVQAWAYAERTQIALSCRSFEYWLLLHFEKANQNFSETYCNACKDGAICQGQTCLNGVLARYLPGFQGKKQVNLRVYLPQLFERLTWALENAAWLRYTLSKQLGAQALKTAYMLSAYTNVDELMLELNPTLPRCIWLGQGQACKLGQEEYALSLDEAGSWKLQLPPAYNLAHPKFSTQFKLRGLHDDTEYNFELNTEGYLKAEAGLSDKVLIFTPNPINRIYFDFS